MLVVPRHEIGYQQVEFFVYLTDVSREDGATRFVSWQKTKDIPVERHTLNYVDYADLYDDPGNAAAPAGSVVAYRPDVYHRSVDFTEPGRLSRVMLHVSFRHRDAGWGGYQAWPFRGFSPELTKFVQQATPRQLHSWASPSPAIPTGTTRHCRRAGPLPRPRYGARGASARCPSLERSAGPERRARRHQRPGHVALGHQRQIEQELLAVVAGQHLQPDRQPVDQPGRDAHGRAAVEVGGCGQRRVVHDGAGEPDLVNEVGAGNGRWRRPFGREGHVGIASST